MNSSKTNSNFSLYFVLGIAVSFMLTVFYSFLNDKITNSPYIKTRLMIETSKHFNGINFYLPFKDEYTVKIKYEKKEGGVIGVIVNNTELELKAAKYGDLIITKYFYLPKDIVKKGENEIQFLCYPKPPKKIDLRIYNYIASSLNNNIHIVLKSSSIFIGRRYSLFKSSIFFIITMIFWLALFIIDQNFFQIFSISFSIFLNILSFFPSIFLGSIAFFISLIGPFHIFFSDYIFYVFSLSSIFFLRFVLLITASFLGIIKRKENKDKKNIQEIQVSRFINLILKRIDVTTNKCDQIFIFFWKYWLKLSFSDKCIFCFALSILFSIFLHSLGLIWLTKRLFEISYFFLFIGISVKFFSLKKC